MSNQPPSKPPTGYGNPPEHSRWQPGRSGNPSGRPKGAKSLKARMQEHLDKVVTVTENGKTVRLTVLDLVFRGVVNAGAKGNPRAAREVFQMIKAYGLNTEPQNDTLFDTDDDVLVAIVYSAQRILDLRGKSHLYAKPTNDEEKRALDKMVQSARRKAHRRH